MANTKDESNLILVRLTKKFANRIYHEFSDDHPHQTAHGGELLVTGDRVAKAARTPGVLGAIMQGVLEEVRDPQVTATPDPVDIEDIVNGLVKPGYAAADAGADDGAKDAAVAAAPTDTAADAAPAATGGKGSK